MNTFVRRGIAFTKPCNLDPFEDDEIETPLHPAVWMERFYPEHEYPPFDDDEIEGREW